MNRGDTQRHGRLAKPTMARADKAAPLLDSFVRQMFRAAMSHPGRRFPPPWPIVEHAGSFSVRDATGFPLAYVYFDERQTDPVHGQKLTKDQARRIASNIAKLPELLKR